MKIIFRICLVHSCYSADLGEPRPKKCTCHKLVTKEQAIELVKNGTADWVINYDHEFPMPTWNVVLRGRAKQTPRSHTLEAAHIQRGLERQDQLAEELWLSDEGQSAKDIEALAMGTLEQAELFELYHDLEMEERYNLFRKCGPELQELKKFSDTFGTMEGPEGKYVSEIITNRADQLKFSFAVDDPFEGRCLFPLGPDQRTGVPKNKS
jgi:hypothetical protein